MLWDSSATVQHNLVTGIATASMAAPLVCPDWLLNQRRRGG
jgi:hypothetical protein